MFNFLMPMGILAKSLLYIDEQTSSYTGETLPEAESAEALAALIARGPRMDRKECRRIPFFPVEGQAVSHDRTLDIIKWHVKNSGVLVGC